MYTFGVQVCFVVEAVIGEFSKKLNRRDMLRGSFLAGGVLLTGLGEARWPEPPERQGATPLLTGKMLGVVDFTEEAPVPMSEAFGEELDGRLYSDLSGLSAENPIIPVDRFYIRTRASNLLDSHKEWLVHMSGGNAKPLDLTIKDLRGIARSLGVHLMECAGNVRSVHFGMISVASWTGVPLSEILEKANFISDGKRVLISGFDSYTTKSASSIPGASWVFTGEQLKEARAFLATEMNGSALTRDHGAPVRLVVPGWYGCTCIKWVNEISLVDDTVPATSQMQEYASRTTQNGVPQLAREYNPAIIEQAAMPIRVEKWVYGEKIKYRVVGILWGGAVPVKKLQIRFNPEEDYVDVENYEEAANDPWNFWTHTWVPSQPGTYMIRLHVADPQVTARRLEAGYYMRTVEISEV